MQPHSPHIARNGSGRRTCLDMIRHSITVVSQVKAPSLLADISIPKHNTTMHGSPKR